MLLLLFIQTMSHTYQELLAILCDMPAPPTALAAPAATAALAPLAATTKLLFWILISNRLEE